MECKEIIEFIQRPEIIVWILIAAIYVLSKIGFGLDYLSVWEIISSHVDCFRSTKTNKILIIPFVDYCVVPFILGSSAAVIKISKQCLVETYHTVMFEILTSVILLVLCLFNVFTKKFGIIQSFLIYSLTFLLIINLLMIIKRIFRIINADMKK